MSAVVKTSTPFVIESVLLAALTDAGAEPIKITKQTLMQYQHSGGLRIGDILTNRSDYYGRQHFRQDGDRWLLRHDSSEMDGRITSRAINSPHYQKVGTFLQNLGVLYQQAYTKHLEILAEEERLRIEKERKERVEETRQQAIEKAKAQGYQIKEQRANGKIQLVLTRTVS